MQFDTAGGCLLLTISLSLMSLKAAAGDSPEKKNSVPALIISSSSNYSAVAM